MDRGCVWSTILLVFFTLLKLILQQLVCFWKKTYLVFNLLECWLMSLGSDVSSIVLETTLITCPWAKYISYNCCKRISKVARIINPPWIWMSVIVRSSIVILVYSVQFLYSSSREQLFGLSVRTCGIAINGLGEKWTNGFCIVSIQ